MKPCAVVTCLFLSAVTLNCHREGVVPPPPIIKKGPEVAANGVQINSCNPDHDQVKVHDGDTFTWSVVQKPVPDNNTYEIVFIQGTPIGTATATVTNSQPVQTKIQKDVACKGNPKACYYPYVLIQKSGTGGSTTCKDPGIHIIG